MERFTYGLVLVAQIFFFSCCNLSCYFLDFKKMIASIDERFLLKTSLNYFVNFLQANSFLLIEKFFLFCFLFQSVLEILYFLIFPKLVLQMHLKLMQFYEK